MHLGHRFWTETQPHPVRGMLLMIENMIKEGISWRK
jgi:hypothetical protein